MALTIFDIIQGPVISDKAYRLNRKFKKLFIRVHPHANKQLVKQALEQLFNVKVEGVNIQNREGKRRIVRRKTFNRPSQKRAIITLAEGYSLDFFEKAQTDIASQETSQAQTA